MDRKTMKTPKYGIYHLTFLDHTHGSPDAGGAMVCDVFGALYKQDDTSYYIAAWVADKDVNNVNNEVFTILKSTVLRKKRLK
jgi:hypothetical protein